MYAVGVFAGCSLMKSLSLEGRVCPGPSVALFCILWALGKSVGSSMLPACTANTRAEMGVSSSPLMYIAQLLGPSQRSLENSSSGRPMLEVEREVKLAAQRGLHGKCGSLAQSRQRCIETRVRFLVLCIELARGVLACLVWCKMFLPLARYQRSTPPKRGFPKGGWLLSYL